jgi:urease accessory protein
MAMRDDSTAEIQLLRLLQLADSALPVGALAHSFGLETLVEEGLLQVANLEIFFRDYLQEMGALEAGFCRAAQQLAQSDRSCQNWSTLNRQLSALKPAREARAGSSTLGRRFLQLMVGLGEWPRLAEALAAAQRNEVEVHHCLAFGLAGGVLGFDEETTALAFLQQSLTGLVSACQRLLPLGQSQAVRILWDLKPAIMESSERSKNDLAEIACFTPLVEMAAMRHPMLETRLFIS